MRITWLFPALLTILVACKSDSSNQPPDKGAKTLPKDTSSTKLIENQETPKIIQSGLELIPYKLTSENCDIEIPEEYDMNGDWCNKREVKGLKVSLNDETIAAKINSQICKAITGKLGDQQTIKKFVAKIKTPWNHGDEVDLLQDEYICKLIDSSNTYLSMTITSSYYALGTPHDNHNTSAINADLSTGQLIKLSDLFVENYRGTFKAFAKRKFLAQNGNEIWWFLTGEQAFDLPKEFLITKKGITFIYQPYEVGPYVAGAPEIFISKKELSKWLKENPYLVP